MLRMSHIFTGTQFKNNNLTTKVKIALSEAKAHLHHGEDEDNLTLKSIKRWWNDINSFSHNIVNHYSSNIHSLVLSVSIGCKALRKISFFSWRKLLFRAWSGVIRQAGSCCNMLHNNYNSPYAVDYLGDTFILHCLFRLNT